MMLQENVIKKTYAFLMDDPHFSHVKEYLYEDDFSFEPEHYLAFYYSTSSLKHLYILIPMQYHLTVEWDFENKGTSLNHTPIWFKELYHKAKKQFKTDLEIRKRTRKLLKKENEL